MDYQLQFETLSLRVLCLSAETDLQYFIFGLRDDIRRELQLRRPYSLSHTIRLAKEIEATFHVTKPLEVTKTHSPYVIQPSPSKFHVSAPTPTVKGDDGTTQSQEETTLLADPTYDVVNDRKKFLPEVFKDLQLPIPIPVRSKRVPCGFENHIADLLPDWLPPFLDVVSIIRFNPTPLPTKSDSKAPKERMRSSKLTKEWAFNTPTGLTLAETPPTKPPDSVSTPTSLPQDQEGYGGTKLRSVVLHTTMQSSIYATFNEMAKWSIYGRDSMVRESTVILFAWNSRMVGGPEAVGFQPLGYDCLIDPSKQVNDTLAQCPIVGAQLFFYLADKGDTGDWKLHFKLRDGLVLNYSGFYTLSEFV